MQRKYKGSFTVETAFLVPFIGIMLVLLIYTAMYLRDVTVVKAIIQKEAAQGADFVETNVYPDSDFVLYQRYLKDGYFTGLMRDDEDDAAEILLADFRDKTKNKLWVSTVEDMDVSVNSHSVMISGVVKGNLSLGTSLVGIKEQFFRRKFQYEYERSELADWSRIVTTVLQTGEKIRGVKTVMSKITQFFNWIGK